MRKKTNSGLSKQVEHVTRADRIKKLHQDKDQEIKSRRKQTNELGPPYPEANQKRSQS
jgi:hypothetical protein